MNTNMKEMNLNEMEAVCGGGINWKNILDTVGSDLYLLALGPIGQAAFLADAGTTVVAEIVCG